MDITSLSDFIHLHLHDTHSFLDGGGKIIDNVMKAKELGMTAMATTNHNHIGGWYEFIDACKTVGIKPILGCEMYQTADTKILSKTADERRQYAIDLATADGIEVPEKIEGKKATKKQLDLILAPYLYNTKQFHLVVLAMNQTGANNLMKLQSEAAHECTYNGRYLCDFDMLEKYNEGLIVLSACLGGLIPNALMKGNDAKAYEYARRYKEIFGDRFYLEIQPLAIEEQKNVNIKIVEMSKKLDIELVATNDVHYTNEEDWDDHDTLLCVGIGKAKEEEDRMHYPREFWVRSKIEMKEAFARHLDLDQDAIDRALSNTSLIANRVGPVKLGSDTPLFPKVNIPKGLTAESYLTLKSFKGLYKYKKEHPEIDIMKYEIRMYEELEIINSKGFAPYILKIVENIEYCEENDIPVGPGRGSAAGSLCLFANGGTKVVDPIKYNLLFFRFLTKDRVDAPDVDSDFSYYGRAKLIKHLEEIHGQEAVCHIGTYTEMGVKSGLKDFGRALRVDFGIMNNISKKIDEITEEAPSVKFKHLDGYRKDAEKALEDGDSIAYNKLMAKYNEFKELENQYPELFRLARKFEGTPRNMGVHASGILVMPCNVTDYFPTRTVDGIRIALFTGPQLESLGAIKLDILGLKTLDVLDKCIKSIDPKLTVNDLYKTIEENLDNPEMFKMAQDKETEGLFQMESPLFKMLCEDIIPTDVNDICAILSIGRPGPLSAGMHTQYAQRKNGFEESIPQLRGTDEITEETYNTIIYQEQCMLIAKKVAKLDDSQSDSILRKALAKKDEKKMELARRLFIYGKKNINAPSNYDENNTNQCIYDPTGKYGAPVLGGIHNGYEEQELLAFWNKLKGYASYLFNKSHSACYAIITLCTMYLKCHHKSKFFAALLSMQSTVEKIDLYSKTAKNLYGIDIIAPSINLSEYDFTEIDGRILYGLKSIKGIGINSITEITSNRPYTSIQDAIDKVSKKQMNKRVLGGLIKAGAFDFQSENRYELLNNMMDIRKDKDERFVPVMYNEQACMNFERDILGTSITYTPLWDSLPTDTTMNQEFTLVSTLEKRDKKGNMMGFIKLSLQGIEIDALVFASTYCKNIKTFDTSLIQSVELRGKKDSKGKFIVSSVVGSTKKNLVSIEEIAMYM